MGDLQFWRLVQKDTHNFGPDSYYEASIPDIMISNSIGSVLESKFNLLKTKRRPLYLKIQSVPRCKHFSSQL